MAQRVKTLPFTLPAACLAMWGVSLLSVTACSGTESADDNQGSRLQTQIAETRSEDGMTVQMRTYLWVDQYPTARLTGIGLPTAGFNVCWFFAHVASPKPLAEEDLQQLFLDKAYPAHPHFISNARLKTILDRRGLSFIKSHLYSFVNGVHDRETWKIAAGNIHEIDLTKDVWEPGEIAQFEQVLKEIKPGDSIKDLVSTLRERAGNRDLTDCQTTREGKALLMAGKTADDIR